MPHSVSRPSARWPGAMLALAMLVAACAGDAQPVGTPPIIPGTAEHPREVNLIARDFAFIPSPLELVPGETVLLHLVNAGLLVHEAVLGDASVQEAWAEAEAALAGAPPGPTPNVQVAPDRAGIRLVAGSGERIDVTFTVPAGSGTVWLVGCHIPGHMAKGMTTSVRWAQPPPEG